MGCGLEMENVITRKHIEKERKKKKFLDAGRSISRHHSKQGKEKNKRTRKKIVFSILFNKVVISFIIYLFIYLTSSIFC